MTLALDSQAQISVAVDDAVKNEVLGPDGQQIHSAIQNGGTIKANGGKVLLTAKALNDVFDFAVNNSGVVQATTLQNHNGVVELISDGDIYSLGTLKSSSLIERGNTFQVGGIFDPGYADVKNADNALVFAANTNVFGTITDPANIIVDPSVTLTMKADTIFNAGNAFTMDPTAIIKGGGYNLSISAGSGSTLGNILNVNLLTLNSGSNGLFKLASAATAVNLTSNSTLDLNGKSLKIAGTFINNGTLKLIGSEKPSIGTFTDNATSDYYGSGSYTITPLGIYNNLQFDNGTFKLASATTAANLTNNTTFDLNGQYLKITGTLANNGTFKLKGSEAPSIGTFADNGITDYYGSGSYTITPLGTYVNLQFNKGMFILGGALSSANLTNNSTFDLNGQSLKVTGALTNNGTLKLIGNETPFIGTFTDNGITDYYGSGTYTIQPLGTYNKLQFNDGTFVLGGALSSASLTNNSVLDLNGQSLTVTGKLTNNGTLKLVGNEKPSIGTFTDKGITNYYGIDSYIITPLGTYNNLQFDNGTFALGGALKSASLTNDTTLDLNGQSLKVTGALTNNGTFKLIGGEKPSIGTFTDNGTTDYYGSGTYSIKPLGVYNYLQFDNGTFVLGGTFTSKASIIIDPNVAIDMKANTNFIAGDGFLMDPTSTINGGGFNLSILSGYSSNLGNIINVNGLTLGSLNGESVTYISQSGTTINANTINVLPPATLVDQEIDTFQYIWYGNKSNVWDYNPNWDQGRIPPKGASFLVYSEPNGPVLPSDKHAGDVTIESGAVFNLTSKTVNQEFTLFGTDLFVSGTLMVYAPTFAENYNFPGGTFLATGSTVKYEGNNQTIATNLNFTPLFYSNLIISGGGTTNIDALIPLVLTTITANGIITINPGVTIDLPVNTSIYAGLGFFMAPTANISGENHNLTINAGALLPFNQLGNINNVGSLTLAGTKFDLETGCVVSVASLTNNTILDLQGQSLTVTGNFTNTITGTLDLMGNEKLNIHTFTDNGSTDYRGSGPKPYTITPLGTYNDLYFENGTFNLSNDLTVKSNLNIQGGATLDAVGSNISVGGNWDNSGSTFNAGTGSVSLTGSGTVTSGGSSFNNLNVNASGTYTVTDGDAIITTGNFTQTSGTFVSAPTVSDPTKGTTFSVGGNFSLKGGKFNRFTGSGTAGDPYLIYDVYGLQGVQGFLSSDFGLANGIDASSASNWNSGSGFVPIGNSSTPFTGSFNGENLTISNFTINNPSNNYMGLFGETSSTAELSNIQLSNVNVTGGSLSVAGGLVGSNGGTVNNSYSIGNVSGNGSGGLVGYNSGTISNSHSIGGVTGFGAGGLAGSNDGTITNSFSIATVSGSNGAVGGLVGLNGSSANISDSYSTGRVSGISGVGGLVGENFRGYISNSNSSANVSGSGQAIGGLVGGSSGTITDSYSSGNVTGTGYIGGLVGANSSGGSITNSYSKGSVSGSSFIGGLVGGNLGTITNSNSTATVSGSIAVGGLVGFSQSGSGVTNSYYTDNTYIIDQNGNLIDPTDDIIITPAAYGIYGGG